MLGRKCYVVLAEDYDGDAYVYGVYSSHAAAELVIKNNNEIAAAAEQWDKDAGSYPLIDMPARPTFAAQHRPPSNTTSKEYLAWLTEKLNFDKANAEWMMLRVKLENERHLAIKTKFGERPCYRDNMSIQESHYE